MLPSNTVSAEAETPFFTVASLREGTVVEAAATPLFMAMYEEITTLQPGVAEDFCASLSKGLTPYSQPKTDLWVIMAGETPAACVGLRQFTDEIAELKRMYVMPEFRGHGLAGILLDQAISFAKEAGYHAIYLDTLHQLETAHRIYYARGFEKIAPYNDLPADMVYHMKLAL